MSKRSITVDHGGKTYYGTVMTINKTSLTVEDHGIVTAYLHCRADGSGIGVGGYCLDTPVKDEAGKHLGREGTAYGMDHLMQIMQTAGVRTWEELPGRQIVVLHESKSLLGSVAAGFANIVDEDKVLIFAEHAEQWLNRELVAGGAR